MAQTSKLWAKVTEFATRINAFATAQTETNRTKRMIQALSGVGAALTETGTESVTVGESAITVEMLTAAVEALGTDISDNEDEAGELTTLAESVKRYIADEVLDEDELDVATKALEVYATVKMARKAQSGVRSADRMSDPDFAFPINATCGRCGEQVVRTGSRSGNTDWNSLRHYAFEHARKVHGLDHFFQGLVKTSWQEAKRTFEDGADAVLTEGDADTPAFQLEKVEAA